MRYATRSIVVLCSVLAALATPVAPAEARRVALVIGNGAYEHTRALPNARNDARVIAALLGKIGFVVSEANDLAYRPMREAIRAFGQTAQGAEMALVYYAGHGLEVAGENWLLPVSSALRHERDLEYEAVSLSSILAAVKDAARLRLVILDACRNNPLGDRIELPSATPRSVPRGLARIEPSGDILVAYSAKHGTLAEDGPAGGNSPFAAALALNLATPGLDVRIMLGKVRDAVKKATAGRQEPFTYGSVGGDVVALLTGPVADAASAKPPASHSTAMETVVALAVPEPGSAPAQLDRDKLTRDLQRQLKRVGCDPGAVDGKWGANAKSALLDFAKHTKVALVTDEATTAALVAVAARKDRACPLEPTRTQGRPDATEYSYKIWPSYTISGSVSANTEHGRITCTSHGHRSCRWE